MHRCRPLLGAGCVAALLVAGCSADDAGPAGRNPADANAPANSGTQVASVATSVSDPPDTTAPPEPRETTVRVSLAEATPTTTTTTTTAESIAVEITATERGIRDTSLSRGSVAALGRRQQQAYQLLARNARLQDAVTALIPADVATAFGFNVAARQAIVDHAAGSPPSEPSATLPAWTIVEPRPIDELLTDYREAEAATGVPWEYLAAINLVETRMGRIRGESSAGALGPMQFLPATWAACCTGDIEDPHDAIVGAALYLASQGAPGDMHAALYGYNPNEGYVGAVVAYALNLIADPLAYRGYHAWEVYFGSAAGTIRLPVGYSATIPLDAAEYARTHPDDVT